MDGGGGGVCEEEVSNVLARFGTSAGDSSSSSFPIWVGGFGGGFGGHARGGGVKRAKGEEEEEGGQPFSLFFLAPFLARRFGYADVRFSLPPF